MMYAGAVHGGLGRGEVLPHQKVGRGRSVRGVVSSVVPAGSTAPHLGGAQSGIALAAVS